MISDDALVGQAERAVAELEERLTLRVSREIAGRLGFYGVSMRVGVQGAAIDVWKRAPDGIEAVGTVFIDRGLRRLWREGPTVAVLRLSSLFEKLPQGQHQPDHTPLVTLL